MKKIKKLKYPDGGKTTQVAPVYITASRSDILRKKAEQDSLMRDYPNKLQAYKDSLALYNNYNRGIDLSKNFDFIQYGNPLTEEQTKQQILKEYGTMRPNVGRSSSGLIYDGGFEYKKSANSEQGKWRKNYNILDNKSKIKPVSYLPQNSYGGKHDYIAMYKQPTFPQEPSVNIQIDKKAFQNVRMNPGWVYALDNKSEEEALNTPIGNFRADPRYSMKGNFTLKDAFVSPRRGQVSFLGSRGSSPLALPNLLGIRP